MTVRSSFQVFQHVLAEDFGQTSDSVRAVLSGIAKVSVGLRFGPRSNVRFSYYMIYAKSGNKGGRSRLVSD